MNTDRTLRLLVIDDDDVDRMLLRRTLPACGHEYELTEYTTVEAIPDLAALREYDCIFLDYLLPGDNGLMLVKKMRDTGIATPIVITTSQGNESIAVSLMKAGASDYLVKSDISAQLLAKVLRNVLALRSVMREREQAQQALRVSEARLAEAQEIARIGSWEFDTASRSFYCSHQVLKMIGVPEGSSMTFDAIMAFVHPEDRPLVSNVWATAIDGKPINFDFRINGPAGVKFVNSRGYAAFDEGGLIDKIIGTLQDITDRKLAEAEVLEAREQADNSLKVREVFLANMSHEIRTPMNAILGFTSLLLETGLTEEQKRFVDAIHFSGENLLVIINDILDLSKIRSGKLSIEKCEFNLSELVSSMLSVMAPKAKEKGLKLTASMDPTIPVLIKGDPVRLNQVLSNLISNAVKFTANGSVSLSIVSQTRTNDGLILEFRVTDTGIGIPEEMQEAIYDKFVQASNDTTRKYGGSGLGLTIVKSLVELQEGTISVTSTPGAGSTFAICLPVERVSDLRPIEEAKAPATGSVKSLRGVSVLAAEDNVLNQMLLRKVMEKAGCPVEIASNGIELLERLAAGTYDIVLMDIQMPEMDGYEATQRIRKMPGAIASIPVVAMTAHAFGSDVTRALACGMTDYISKPFKAPDLYAKIREHVPQKVGGAFLSLNKGTGGRVDLSALISLGRSDAAFVDSLLAQYDKQTPAFVQQLRNSSASGDAQSIRKICHEIKSSYGIVQMPELKLAIQEVDAMLDADALPEADGALRERLENVISLIRTIHGQVKTGLRRTG